MTLNRLRIILAVALVVGLGCAGYLLFNTTPPVDPQADRIAFVSTTSVFLLGPSSGSIYITNVDLPGLTQVSQQANQPWALSWSPQGDRIAYYDYDTQGLYIINANGADKPELLWKASPGMSVVDLSWSPDDSTIAFSNGVDIYLLDLATHQISRLTDGSISVFDLTWSPGSDKIAFTLMPSVRVDGRPDSSIGVINIDGSGFTQLTPNDKSRSPEWSPNGQQLVFQREGNIYIMNSDGSAVKALTEDGLSRTPTWSPDGTRIAFISTKNQRCGPSFADGLPFCTSSLYVMNVDGSNITLIRSKDNENIRQPVWAPRN